MVMVELANNSRFRFRFIVRELSARFATLSLPRRQELHEQVLPFPLCFAVAFVFRHCFLLFFIYLFNIVFCSTFGTEVFCRLLVSNDIKRPSMADGNLRCDTTRVTFHFLSWVAANSNWLCCEKDECVALVIFNRLCFKSIHTLCLFDRQTRQRRHLPRWQRQHRQVYDPLFSLRLIYSQRQRRFTNSETKRNDACNHTKNWSWIIVDFCFNCVQTTVSKTERISLLLLSTDVHDRAATDARHAARPALARRL